MTEQEWREMASAEYHRHLDWLMETFDGVALEHEKRSDGSWQHTISIKDGADWQIVEVWLEGPRGLDWQRWYQAAKAKEPLPPREPALPPQTGGKDWQGYPVYESARALLQAGLSCRSPRKGSWSIYPTEFGAFAFYPGDEGPQEAHSIDEVLGWIGGDQEASLTQAGRRQLSEREATR